MRKLFKGGNYMRKYGMYTDPTKQLFNCKGAVQAQKYNFFI